MEAHSDRTGDLGDRRSFLAGSLVGGALLIGGTAACVRKDDEAGGAAATELSALKAQYADPQKAPIEHVAGPRMGREVLNRLEYSKRQVSNDPKMVAEVESIMQAIRRGDELVRANKLPCW